MEELPKNKNLEENEELREKKKTDTNEAPQQLDRNASEISKSRLLRVLRSSGSAENETV